ncbi:MAG TPA: response regulator [Flavobacterium sp.]|jgi:CheY-like chemotaxis protein
MSSVHNKLIFVIDDDQDDLQMMQEIILSIGHYPQSFCSGSDMFSYISTHTQRPDVIFLDVCLPQVDGFEILREIKSSPKLHDVPVVIYSAKCDEKCVSKCFELGANYFLPKACTIKEVRESIQHALDKDWSSWRACREEFLHQS